MKHFFALFFFITLQLFIFNYSSAGTSCRNPQNTSQCMVCNCYNEAGNQGYQGQVEVGKVVMSRVGLPHWPNSVCNVVRQRKQFSWFNRYATRRSVPSNHSCNRAAQEALRFRGCSADHYHATYVRPRGRRRMTRVSRVQSHIFYSKFCGRANMTLARRNQDRQTGRRTNNRTPTVRVASASGNSSSSWSIFNLFRRNRTTSL